MFYAPNITSGLFEPIIVLYDTSMYRHLFPFNFLEQPDNVRIWKKIVNPVINSAWMSFWYSLKENLSFTRKVIRYNLSFEQSSILSTIFIS